MVCMLDLQLSEPNYPYYMFTQKSFTLRLSQSLPRSSLLTITEHTPRLASLVS